MNKLLEICAGEVTSVEAAVRGGAQRVELCSALDVGGGTPAAGFVRGAVTCGIRCHVLVRPREGDFVYSSSEVDAMLADIDMAAVCGAAGVAIGALTADGEIDTAVCTRLVDRARSHGLSVTFHRAFDCAVNPFEAIAAVLGLGADRLLTSGCAPSAAKGVKMLKQLNDRAGGRIRLIAAAGVNSGNAAEILAESGCREIHASARRPVTVCHTNSNRAVSDGFYSDTRLTTDPAEVRAIVNAIQNSAFQK